MEQVIKSGSQRGKYKGKWPINEKLKVYTFIIKKKNISSSDSKKGNFRYIKQELERKKKLISYSEEQRLSI